MTVSVLIVIFPALLLWQLSHLQVMPGEEKGFKFLQSQGAARTLRSETLSAYRGVITDRNGELLAVSTPVTSIYANPGKIKNEDIPAIAKALGQSNSWLLEKLARYQGKQFLYLARHLTPHDAKDILNKKYSGIYSETEYRRYYPAGEVAAHVVGFTNIDDRGQEGVELSFNDWLAGAQGSKRVVKDLKGNVVKDLGLLKAPKSGSDVQLTIDMKLQYIAYRELKKSIAAQGAKSGSVVLLDVESGEILAMVNQPSYNPNDRESVKAYQLRNRALTDIFEPGSTMKPFTIMSALESGKFTVNHQVDTTPGHVRVKGKTFLDPVNYGVMDLTKILKKSSQVGITKIALELEPESVVDVFSRVGLGQDSGIGFPGESVGGLPQRARWSEVERATFAFGYGLNVNALQLAQAYSVIANDGLLTPVSLIRNVKKASTSRVIDEAINNSVREMLKTTAEKGGTAVGAQIDAYPVAGKTGTAHKVGRSGYVEDKYVALFAGFAPAENPKIVGVVIVNEPPSENNYSGGKAAAPIFSSVVEQALKSMNVAPIKTGSYLAGAQNSEANTLVADKSSLSTLSAAQKVGVSR